MKRLNKLASMALTVLLMAVDAIFAQSGDSTPRFQFREPRSVSYRIESTDGQAAALAAAPEWLEARLDNGSSYRVELGRNVVLQIGAGTDLAGLLRKRPLAVRQSVTDHVFVLEAADAWTAAEQAHELAQQPGVLASVPVMRRPIEMHGRYAPKPTDPYFTSQWHLENRLSDGTRNGPDVNVRSAWPHARGAGVTIAIVDNGVELAHPDLAPQAVGPHRNFLNNSSDGSPQSSTDAHGTAVAGLAAASGGNGIGISGTAPGAGLASWVIFGPNGLPASDLQLQGMFQFSNDVVAVQNHSWGFNGGQQLGPSLLESIAISNAIASGRGGRGVVMVRAGGNGRALPGDSNNDGYANDPRVIAVGAVRSDGRVAAYSNPGACLLVAAPSSENGFPTLFTTDLLGAAGYNQITFTNDLADYAFGTFGFTGTSGAAPQISGIAALMLSVNPLLGYRDVQQILALSSRHFDLADWDVHANGAGFRVSHNVGFGVPDAGQAVKLAKTWPARPPLTMVTNRQSGAVAIPQESTRLAVTASNLPPALQSITARPANNGPRADKPTASLPLADVGKALGPIAQDLNGKTALIQRGDNFFTDKIRFAANAGAAFAVIYNNVGTDDLVTMSVDEFIPIPAIFIGRDAGEQLRNFITTNSTALAQVQLGTASYTFTINQPLICEHVGVTITCGHPFRGDLRITLISPQGTVSVLQKSNNDNSPGPAGWTYYSTHHFYESSVGTWTLHVSDEVPGDSGSLTEATLVIRGVAITDSDKDGLDDAWEMAHFGTLGFGPKDDPDGDGHSNAREQATGGNPAAREPIEQDISLWNDDFARLCWPGREGRSYEIYSESNASTPFSLLTTVPGRYPETEFFHSITNLSRGFFFIREVNPQ